VFDADKHTEFLEDPDALNDDFDGLDEEQVEELKRECVIIFFWWFHSLNRDLDRDSWERSHKALKELCHIIPNFRKKIDEAEPEELSEYYSQVRFIFTTFPTKQKSPSSRLVPTMHVAMTLIVSGITWLIGWTNPYYGLLLPLPKTNVIIVAFVTM
jgi:hypothetical protein